MLSHQKIGRQLHDLGNQILSTADPPASAAQKHSRSVLHACHGPTSTAKAWAMSVLALDQTAPNREGGDSAAKAWLRALAATAPITAHPGRTLPALIESICAEENHHIMVGQETYFRSVDGILMPTRKDQPPPDLRNFDQPPK
jgi:hypothetical protein